jgi:hypothetical protein
MRPQEESRDGGHPGRAGRHRAIRRSPDLLGEPVERHFSLRVPRIALDGVDAQILLPAGPIAKREHGAGQVVLRQPLASLRSCQRFSPMP